MTICNKLSTQTLIWQSYHRYCQQKWFRRYVPERILQLLFADLQFWRYSQVFYVRMDVKTHGKRWKSENITIPIIYIYDITYNAFIPKTFSTICSHLDVTVIISYHESSWIYDIMWKLNISFQTKMFYYLFINETVIWTYKNFFRTKLPKIDI